MVETIAKEILSGPNAVALFMLACFAFAPGLYVGYFLVQKFRNGKNGTTSELLIQIETIKILTQQLIDRVHALEDGISALRKEHGAHADAHAALRERVAMIEGEWRARD